MIESKSPNSERESVAPYLFDPSSKTENNVCFTTDLHSRHPTEPCFSELTHAISTQQLLKATAQGKKGKILAARTKGARKFAAEGTNRRTLTSGTKKKCRRLDANARERARMHGLKQAFDHLRQHLPTWASDRQMSKYDTLLMAQMYITRLQTILDRS